MEIYYIGWNYYVEFVRYDHEALVKFLRNVLQE